MTTIAMIVKFDLPSRTCIANMISKYQGKPLIVRLRNWVGDVILGVPALQLLERNGYELILVGNGWAPKLLSGFPWKVHVRPKGLKQRIDQYRSLRQECQKVDPEFDKRINSFLLPTSFSSALETRLAGLKSVGYQQEARGLLLRKSVQITYGEHALTSYWNLATNFQALTVEPPAKIYWKITEEAHHRAIQILTEKNINGRYIVLCPFAGGLFEKQEKTWPAFADFSQLARTLGYDLVAIPGPGEQALLKGFDGVIALNDVNLAVYGAILARASLMISNDTGPGHLAAAVGTPVLSVLGPTKPEQWAPWGPNVHILRHWPRWPTPEEVLGATQQIIEGRVPKEGFPHNGSE
jgi:heptosyltransferase II